MAVTSKAQPLAQLLTLRGLAINMLHVHEGRNCAQCVPADETLRTLPEDATSHSARGPPHFVNVQIGELVLYGGQGVDLEYHLHQATKAFHADIAFCIAKASCLRFRAVTGLPIGTCSWTMSMRKQTNMPYHRDYPYLLNAYDELK